jgi:hypothetical protein
MLVCVAADEVKFPDDGCAPGWTRAGQVVDFIGDELFDYIDGGAESFLEFGFERVLVQKYRNNSAEIAIEVYGMQSGEAALGSYLMCCGKETPVAGVSSRNSGDRYQFTILHGRYLVRVNNFLGKAEFLPVMVKLTQQILAELPTAACQPLLEVLPQQGLVVGSERLLRGPVALQSIFTLGTGDILQLKGKLFAMSGDYQSDQGEAYTLLVVPYPETQQASAAYQHLLANLDSYLQVVSQADRRFVFVDYQQKFGLVELQEAVLTVRLHLGKKPDAGK